MNSTQGLACDQGKIAGQALRSGAPGAIPTRDLPLRSQFEDVYLSYLRVSQTAQTLDLH